MPNKPGNGKKQMKKQLRVAIAGLGIGRYHLAAFAEVKTCRVVAICDLREERLTEFGERYGVPGRYQDYKKMLQVEQPDIFVVSLPNVLHHPATMAGLDVGAHILCEKPMAMNAAEAARMCKAAEQAGRRIMIGHSYRFEPASLALKKLVDEGELGDIYFARTVWHRRRGIPDGWFVSRKQSGGGALIDLGVHRLDLALWLMGNPEPASVMAATYSVFGPRQLGSDFDVDDLAAGFIRFTNGSSLVMEASWACERERVEEQRTELMGTRGGAAQFNIGDSYKYDMALYKEIDGILMKVTPAELEPKTQTMQGYFADCIIKGKEPMAGGAEGLRVMRILDAMYKSARTGKAVNLSDA